MRYVMVPVPSEFVLDVMRMVLFRAPDDEEVSGMRDEARLRKLLEGVDDNIRSLLVLVAKATIEDTPLRFSDAVADLEQDGDTLRTTLRELNGHALGGGRELVALSDQIAVRVNGNVGRNRYLIMRPEHARCIRSLTRTAEPSDA